MIEYNTLLSGKTLQNNPVVCQITIAGVWGALQQGLRDFSRRPSHYGFVVLIYPVIGMALFTWASGGNAVQLLFPMVPGFALLGPFAAIGLYEMSRRLEKNLDTSWKYAFGVFKSPAMPAIAVLAVMLLGLFLLWIATAQSLYWWLYADLPPASILDFIKDAISTRRGLILIVIGNGVGFCFALIALCTTVVAFPLLLDRDVGVFCAIHASISAVKLNPVPMLFWGAIVASSLFLGMLLAMAGLIVILPVLGHAI